MPSERTHLFSAGSFDADRLEVASFTGEEALSSLYRFDVVFSVQTLDEAAVEQGVLGRRGRLRTQIAEGVGRTISGIVTSVRLLDANARAGRLDVQARLAPALALAKLRRTSRVFQHRSSIEVVEAVLDEVGVKHERRLSRKYQPREYRLQYEENDYAFVRRILAEEGVFFFFDQPPVPAASLDGDHSVETLVLCDDASGYGCVGQDDGPAATPRSLVFREDVGMQGEREAVERFEPRRSVRTKSVRRTDWDPHRPNLDLTVTARAGTPVPAIPPDLLEHYDHHGDLLRPALAPESATIALEQLRRTAMIASGVGTCRSLAPGHRFKLEEHPVPGLNTEWVVTRVHHEGHTPEMGAKGPVDVYRNSFACAPASVAFRPPVSRRVMIQSLESATVVGPHDDDIWSDGSAVCIQFHWDRDGKNDDKSSCWVRVMQPWAGAGWGTSFVPRIGMEVLVAFLGGDPDKPVVIGSAYNTAHPSPFGGRKTRSGIRSQSTPGGGGFNEIAMEDAKGQEQLSLQAERDLVQGAKRNSSHQVGHDHSVKVHHSQSIEVGKDRSVKVTGHEDTTVGGNRRDLTEGNARIEAQGGLTIAVGGSHSVTAGKSSVLKVLGDYGLIVGTPEAGNSNNIHVFGDYLAGATGRVNLRGDKGITLSCGGSSITISSDGIEIKGKSVKLVGTESVSMAGKGPSLKLGEAAEMRSDKIKLFAKDAWLVLDKNVAMKGEMVKLNCDDETASAGLPEDAQPKLKPFKMKLTDADVQPYKGKKYQLLVDGATYEGTTDGDGNVDKKIPEDAKAITVVAWIGDYPTGEQRTWKISRAALPPATTVQGAQLRLTNLGYYKGDPTKEIDAATKGAIASFQTDSGLSSTGILDKATADKLVAVHGN
jgi:type VI secretion system secreted protein VgrG